jgi:hypothetical protein
LVSGRHAHGKRSVVVPLGTISASAGVPHDDFRFTTQDREFVRSILFHGDYGTA